MHDFTELYKEYKSNGIIKIIKHNEYKGLKRGSITIHFSK